MPSDRPRSEGPRLASAARSRPIPAVAAARAGRRPAASRRPPRRGALPASARAQPRSRAPRQATATRGSAPATGRARDAPRASAAPAKRLGVWCRWHDRLCGMRSAGLTTLGSLVDRSVAPRLPTRSHARCRPGRHKCKGRQWADRQHTQQDQQAKYRGWPRPAAWLQAATRRRCRQTAPAKGSAGGRGPIARPWGSPATGPAVVIATSLLSRRSIGAARRALPERLFCAQAREGAGRGPSRRRRVRAGRRPASAGWCAAGGGAEKHAAPCARRSGPAPCRA